MQHAFETRLPQIDCEYVSEDYVYEDGESGTAIGSDYAIENAETSHISLAPDTARRIPPHAHSLPVPAAVLASSRLALGEIAGVMAASRLERPPVPRVRFGISQVDELTGGLPRGSLTEICGAASSGRTSLVMSAMAEASARGELCALVDASDSFDPRSAVKAGLDLRRLLWVRCAAGTNAIANTPSDLHGPDVTALCSTLRKKQAVGSVMPHAKVWYGRSPARSERGRSDTQTSNKTANENRMTETIAKGRRALRDDDSKDRRNSNRHWARCIDQALRATDLLLQGGGFGLIVVDLGDVACDIARRVPLTSWFRFRRAVENTPTVLLSVVRQSCAKTCASLVLEMQGTRHIGGESKTSGIHDLRSTNECPAHAHIFTGLDVTIDIVRCSEQQQNCKKPPRPARTTFESRTEWAAETSIHVAIG